MQADELRMAVTKVVGMLERAKIASVVDQYRSAKGDQRAEAQAGLRQAAGIIMDQFASMSASERQVTKILHLDSLGSREYWLDLFGSVVDPKKHQGEIVRLASRIMFASNHLPGLLNLVKQVNTTPQITTQPLDQGDSYLCIRLTDAGEKASDPDRVARSIDGIDMLYSACASIARKPATDIRLDNVIPKRNRDRDLVFAGERDSIAAVYAIINSIPETLAELDPEQDIDLDAIVQSLPIFEDLNTLASLGTFSKQDLKDISDTMHQGALLTLESGVIPVDPTEVILASEAAHAATLQKRAASAPPARAPDTRNEPAEVLRPSSPVERDEHYERYLREREAMLRPQVSNEPLQSRVNTSSAPGSGDPGGRDPSVDKSRKAAVDDLLKSLGQNRGN